MASRAANEERAAVDWPSYRQGGVDYTVPAPIATSSAPLTAAIDLSSVETWDLPVPPVAALAPDLIASNTSPDRARGIAYTVGSAQDTTKRLNEYMETHGVNEDLAEEIFRTAAVMQFNIHHCPKHPRSLNERLTFGVELEFNIASLTPTTDNKSPYDAFQDSGYLVDFGPWVVKETDQKVAECQAYDYGRWYAPVQIPSKPHDMAMKHVFTTHGFPVTIHNYINCPDSARADDPPAEQIIVGWFVKQDGSIRAPTFDRHDLMRGFSWEPLEIVSPVLDAVAKGFEHTHRVVTMLNTTFRTNVNRSTGLHIHVGNGSDAFDLNTLKNFLATVWTMEPEIHRLHPRYRCSPSGSTFGSAFRIESLGRYPEKGEVKAVLGRIFEAKNILGLRKAINNIMKKHSAYNLMNLSAWAQGEEDVTHYKRKPIETIEFRQHEGTMDARRVVNWARFCTRLVDWARKTDSDSVQRFMTEQLEKQESGPRKGMSIWTFAAYLGLKDVAADWKPFVKEKERLAVLSKKTKYAKARNQKKYSSYARNPIPAVRNSWDDFCQDLNNEQADTPTANPIPSVADPWDDWAQNPVKGEQTQNKTEERIADPLPSEEDPWAELVEEVGKEKERENEKERKRKKEREREKEREKETWKDDDGAEQPSIMSLEAEQSVLAQSYISQGGYLNIGPAAIGGGWGDVFDSDIESPYGSELAYYGKAGQKPLTYPKKAKCVYFPEDPLPCDGCGWGGLCPRRPRGSDCWESHERAPSNESDGWISANERIREKGMRYDERVRSWFPNPEPADYAESDRDNGMTSSEKRDLSLSNYRQGWGVVTDWEDSSKATWDSEATDTTTNVSESGWHDANPEWKTTWKVLATQPRENVGDNQNLNPADHGTISSWLSDSGYQDTWRSPPMSEPTNMKGEDGEAQARNLDLHGSADQTVDNVGNAKAGDNKENCWDSSDDVEEELGYMQTLSFSGGVWRGVCGSNDTMANNFTTPNANG